MFGWTRDDNCRGMLIVFIISQIVSNNSCGLQRPAKWAVVAAAAPTNYVVSRHDAAAAASSYYGLESLHGHHQLLHASAKLNAVIRSAGYEQEKRLAVRHNRRDPLHHLAHYKGGYNLQDKHYWASTLFTGIHGYLLGILWLTVGFSWTLALSIRHCHSKRSGAAKKHNIDKSIKRIPIQWSYMKLAPILVATFFLPIIIGCCGLIIVGSQRLHIQAKRVERTIIVEGAGNATKLIRNVTDTMGQMKMDLEHYDDGVAKRLDNTTMKLHNASTNILSTFNNHKSILDSTLVGLLVALDLLACLNVAIWTIGLALLYAATPRLKLLFIMIFLLAWFLVFLNWETFGLTFALSNFADDTCEALKEYQQSSRNTTLDNILPCKDLASGSKTVLGMRERIYKYIEEANQNITKTNASPNRRTDDTQEVIPHVCNPFLGPPTYSTTSSCKEGTISVSRLPQLLPLLKCPPSANYVEKKAASFPCISSGQYDIANAYVQATEKLLSLLPQVENLTNCSFVVDTFAIIISKQCRPLKHSIQEVWVAMVVVSALTTLTMLLWLLGLVVVRRTIPQSRGIVIPHDHLSSTTI